MMDNFNRQYRLSAGVPGRPGFEVGAARADSGEAIHISFALEKTDSEEGNSGKIQLWNLSPEHQAMLQSKDCVVNLRAGYGNIMPLIFSGNITYAATSPDGADSMSEIEATDGRVAIRDTYITLSFSGRINGKKIIDNAAEQMGVALALSPGAAFSDFTNGFSFVGAAKGLLSKVCRSNGLVWSIQNGVLQIRKPNEPISTRVFLVSPETGLLGRPKHITIAAETSGAEAHDGWEIRYLLNGAIGVNDCIRLESKAVTGNFRVYRLSIDGDNVEGDWSCTAQVLEVS